MVDPESMTLALSKSLSRTWSPRCGTAERSLFISLSTALTLALLAGCGSTRGEDGGDASSSNGSSANGSDADGLSPVGSGEDGSGSDGTLVAQCRGTYTTDSGAPKLVQGNPATCSEVLGTDALLFRIDPAESGTYTSPDGNLTVTITMESERKFSFTTDGPVCGVTSKGGPAAYVYEFEASTGSEGLVAPNGLGISHIDFCYGCTDCEKECPPDYELFLSSEGEYRCAPPSDGPPCPECESECPPNYELLLSSEGEYRCSGPPDNGVCPAGYTLDLASEGAICVPSSP